MILLNKFITLRELDTHYIRHSPRIPLILGLYYDMGYDRPLPDNVRNSYFWFDENGTFIYNKFTQLEIYHLGPYAINKKIIYRYATKRDHLNNRNTIILR